VNNRNKDLRPNHRRSFDDDNYEPPRRNFGFVPPRSRAAGTRSQTPALLKGLIFGPTGTAMTPTATKKGSRLYRYYASMDLIRGRATGTTTTTLLRLPADMVENAVVHEIRFLVQTPEIVAQTVAAARQEQLDMDGEEVVAALNDFDALWSLRIPVIVIGHSSRR
jgi:hypothetical protein